MSWLWQCPRYTSDLVRHTICPTQTKGFICNRLKPDEICMGPRVSSETTASTSSWAHFSHDADIGVVGMGPTKAEAFRQAALALTAVVTDPRKVQPLQPVPVL